MNAKIIHVEQTEQGKIGVFILDGRTYFFTMERDDNDPLYKPIPNGIWNCVRHSGEKYKNTFEILVPGRSDCVFHNGNKENASRGCVILGMTVGMLNGARAVLSSIPAFTSFKFITRKVDSFILKVEDCY